MNFQEIEKLRIELLSALPNLFGKTKLFKIVSFYSAVLATDDKNIIEAYSLDFIIEYLSELKLYTPYYQAPEKTLFLLSQLEKLKTVSTLSQFEKELMEIIDSIKHQLDLLIKILEGKSNKTSSKYLRFPVIESSSNTSNIHSFGSLESVNIKIHKTKNSNRFVFVPSGSKIEERLLQQAQISLEIALNYLSKHKHKFHKHHEVLVYFENLSANYEGNSLGVVLTIGFIEQLSLLYNLPYVTHVTNNLATTGGVTESGKIIDVGKEIIGSKTEAVFFSDIDTFVVPKEDENAASSVLKILFNDYPERNLKIAPIADIKDFINRRDLVDIKKQVRVVRTVRSIRKNWLTSLLIFLLTSISIFLYVRDFDDNPAIIEAQENTMFVKNKSGRILWTREISYSNQDNIYKIIPRFYHLLEDINNDGVNEVIVSQETFPDSLSYLRGRIACFSNKGKLIWQRMFNDTVQAKYQIIDDIYNSKLIGIVNEGKRKVLLCSASNGSNFPSAIFKIDALNGNRIEGTLWNPGHIMMGLIRKKDNGRHEIVCNMYNNDYERTGIFGIDYEYLSGTAPYSKERYKLLGIENAKLNFYLLVPNTDYNSFYKHAKNKPSLAIYDEKRFDAITFSTYESESEEQLSVGYEYKYRTGDINIVIVSYFKARRDSLVAHGKLKPPYTDTPEYKALLKSQIMYWNGERFLKKN